MTQTITVPYNADKLEVLNNQEGTNHFIKVQSSQTGGLNSPTLIIESRAKGASTYEVLKEIKVVGRYNFNVNSKSIEEFRFTIAEPQKAEFDTLTITHDASAGLADNSNLNTDPIDRILGGRDYMGSFSSLSQLNSTRAASPVEAWAVVTDGSSATIAYSNGTVFALSQQSGPTDEDILLEGLASGFLYVNQMEAG
jgi:hypothetical protein